MPQMYRVKTEFAGLSGSPYLSQLYFDAQGGSATDAVNNVSGFWDALDNVMSTDLDWNVLQDVEVVESTTGSIVSVASTPGGSGSGELTGDPLPYAVQGLIRLRTGVFVGGREIRGRVFVPGLTELASTDGMVSTSTSTVLENSADLLVSGSSIPLVIYSRKNLQFAQVTASSAWNQFAVLRSRRD